MEITMSFALAACEAIAREALNPRHIRPFSFLIILTRRLIIVVFEGSTAKRETVARVFF
jgi:hypothetical protein